MWLLHSPSSGMHGVFGGAFRSGSIHVGKSDHTLHTCKVKVAMARELSIQLQARIRACACLG